MAGPSKVEFPGQKKQRMKMRGTKQANEATAKKLERQLGKFLDNPRGHLPAMTFRGKMRWGRTDPVTKTLIELDRIVKKKNDLKWLSKRMMSKRGNPVAKAFAGSLHAAHDEQFTLVGQFNSTSFGSASYVRRGDGKPGYLAGIQNYLNVTLRMLPWEDHAKRGMYFFSWEGGFVCTGPDPTPPEAWIEDVLKRSRFTLADSEIEGVRVWVTEGLVPEDVVQGKPSPQGHITLRFHSGQVVGIGFDALGTFSKKDTSFIHHLALSMLPPIVPSIMKVEAAWCPEGWPEDRSLPEASLDAIDRVLDAWQGLSMNEGIVANSIKQSVMETIEEGLIIGEHWLVGDDVNEIEESLKEFAGSNEERHLASRILHAALQSPHEDTQCIRIEARGNVEQREERAVRIMSGATCGAALGAFWPTHGLESLIALGMNEKESQTIWEVQLNSPKPFGKFLKGLDETMALAQQRGRFPDHEDDGGASSQIRSLTIRGLTEGFGLVERDATSRKKDSIDAAAAAWAWLVAVNRSTGQEWHFDSNARDKGGVWSQVTKSLNKAGERLLAAEESDIEGCQEHWSETFAALQVVTGEQV